MHAHLPDRERNQCGPRRSLWYSGIANRNDERGTGEKCRQSEANHELDKPPVMRGSLCDVPPGARSLSSDGVSFTG